jgi:hypothetical protein
MRPEHGRKAFIILSDGVSFRDKTSIGTAIEYAQRADTMADRPKFYRPGRAAIHAMAGGHGKSVMQRLAGETGGANFEISPTNTLGSAYLHGPNGRQGWRIQQDQAENQTTRLAGPNTRRLLREVTIALLGVRDSFGAGELPQLIGPASGLRLPIGFHCLPWFRQSLRIGHGDPIFQ